MPLNLQNCSSSLFSLVVINVAQHRSVTTHSPSYFMLTAHPSSSWPVSPITRYTVDTSLGCWRQWRHGHVYSRGKWVTLCEQILPQQNRTPRYTSHKHSALSSCPSLPKPANMTAAARWIPLPSPIAVPGRRNWPSHCSLLWWQLNALTSLEIQS